MKNNSTFTTAAAAFAAIFIVTAAYAQENKAPLSGQMMQHDAMPGNKQGGEMSGMQGMMPMMKMMTQMGPMMEQCTKMMAAMNDRMDATPKIPDDNG